MTYRIDHRPGTLVFEGLLDAGALADLRRRAHLAAGPAEAPLELILAAGTEVERAALEALVGLSGVRVIARAPHLALWIRSLEGGRR